jgi:hypothetical protein
LKRVEIPATYGWTREPVSFEWHHGAVKLSRFIGRAIWTEEGKVIRSLSSWLEWMKMEEFAGYDFGSLPSSSKDPIIVTISSIGRLTLWDGFHRVAFSIVNEFDPVNAKLGIERLRRSGR